MKPFNLEEAKAGKPVCTRDGRPARIVEYDYNSAKGFPILAVVQLESGNGNTVYSYTETGELTDTSGTSKVDLFMAPVTKTVWVNLYRMNGFVPFVGEKTYESEHAAKEGRSSTGNCIGTLPITYEE